MAAYVQPVVALPSGAHTPPKAAIVQALNTAQTILETQTGRRLRVARKIVVVRVPIRGRLTAASIATLNVSIPAGPDTVDAVFYASSWLDAFGNMPNWGNQGHIAAVGMGDTPQVVGRVMLHELFHAMSIVPVDAPHANVGHVTDCANDLMNPGILSIARPVIDCGHDDYWDNLLKSPWLV